MIVIKRCLAALLCSRFQISLAGSGTFLTIVGPANVAKLNDLESCAVLSLLCSPGRLKIVLFIYFMVSEINI